MHGMIADIDIRRFQLTRSSMYSRGQWEQLKSLKPKDPADANNDRDNDGFTNLEEYPGSLTGEFAPEKQ